MARVGFLLLLWAVVAALEVGTTVLPTAGTWADRGRPTPTTVDALVMDGGRLLAGGSEGLFESTDGDPSWRAVPDLQGRPVTALAADAEWVFAAGPDHLWARSNGRWMAIEPPPEGAVERLAIVGDRLLAATEAGLFAGPIDGTGTWDRLWPAPAEPPAAVHAVAEAGEQLLLGTDDGVVMIGGEAAAGRTLGPAGSRVTSIGIGGTRVHIAIRGPGGGLARAALGSDLWEHGSLDSEYATTVLVDPRGSSHLYASLGGQATARYVAGVVLSEDAGSSWTPIGGRLLNSFVPTLVLDAEGGALYASTSGGGVYRYRMPTPLHQAAEMARPLLEAADLLLLGLATLALLLHLRLWPARHREPGSPPAT